jgi:hypothetical protein
LLLRLHWLGGHFHGPCRMVSCFPQGSKRRLRKRGAAAGRVAGASVEIDQGTYQQAGENAEYEGNAAVRSRRSSFPPQVVHIEPSGPSLGRRAAGIGTREVAHNSLPDFSLSGSPGPSRSGGQPLAQRGAGRLAPAERPYKIGLGPGIRPLNRLGDIRLRIWPSAARSEGGSGADFRTASGARSRTRRRR